MSDIHPLGVIEAEGKRLAVTRERAAFLIDCSVKHIDRLTKERKLQKSKDGSFVRITMASIERYVRRHCEHKGAA